MTCPSYSTVTRRGLRERRVEAEEAFLMCLSTPLAPEGTSPLRRPTGPQKAMRPRDMTFTTDNTSTRTRSELDDGLVEAALEAAAKETVRWGRLWQLLTSVRAWLDSISQLRLDRPAQQETFSPPEIMLPEKLRGVPSWAVPAGSFYEPDRRDELERMRDPFPRVPRYGGNPPWTTRYHPDLVRRPRLRAAARRDEE